jgi:hypothetical protein
MVEKMLSSFNREVNMNRLKKEMKKAEAMLSSFFAEGFITNGTQTAMEKVKRINERGPLVSMVYGLNAEWFRKEYESGHVVRLVMKDSRPFLALIYDKK